jgi:uncharacterized protein (TIGR00251 family)
MTPSGPAKNEAGPGRNEAPPLRLEGERLTLRVHVQPGARRAGWAGRHGDAFKLRVAARAVDGQANAACIEFLSGSTGVPRSAITLVHGERSRDKLFRIDGVGAAQFHALMEALGA